MALLNAISCLTTAGNTGIQTCFCDPKFIQGAILAPKGTVLTTSTLSAFQTALTNGIYATSKSGRMFPIYDFESPKDGSESKIVQSMANGAKHVVREGFNQWGFQYVNGGLSLLQNLRKFNGPNFDFFFIDNDPTGQKIFGIQGATANTIQAIPSTGGYFWAEPWKLNDGSKITGYEVEFCYNTKFINDQVAYVQMPINFDFPTSYPGLDDAIVGGASVVSAVSKTFNITLLNPLGVDLVALNSVALASPAMWAGCITTPGGLPLTVSTTTFFPAINGQPAYMQLVLAVTNYPTPPAPLLINLSVPSVLAAAGLDFESTGTFSIASV